MNELTAWDGALLVDKPVGPTSHDIIDRIRRVFQLKKVGHAGTLDPAATGLLIVLLGRGTKLSERLMGGDKIYEGTFKLGETTSSYDADGDLVSSLPVPPLTVEELNAYANELKGDQMQLPPMVSAVKINGVPLYKLARKGVEVERKARLIRVFEFLIRSYNEPLAEFRVACTKGTYVRTLVHDLGQKAGCGAHLFQLRRLASGEFKVANAIKFAELLETSPAEVEKRIIPFLKLAQPGD
jgi:tRNA pseudouridine55 synthase